MKVLLIGYETEVCSLFHLGNRLKKDGHDVLVASGDIYNFLTDRISSYFENQPFNNWRTLKHKYESLYEDDLSVDWEYLRDFEEQYCVNKNFHQLLMSDPSLSRHHHHREPYYTPIESKKIVYYWAQSMIEWMEDVFEEFDPDILFTYRRNYFVKNTFAQMAMSTNRPIFNVIRSRIGDYHHLTRRFGLGPDLDARSYVLTSEEQIDTCDAENYVRKFQSADDYASLYDASSQDRLGQERLFSIQEIISEYTGDLANQFLRRVIMRQKKNYSGFLKGNHFDSYGPNVVRFITGIALNKIRYRYRNPFIESSPDCPFIYYPLHTLPESSTLTLSTEYFERDLIRFISKELPANLVLAVKENPNMIGIRPFNVYAELKRIPNVKLIDPKVPSKRLIESSEGVCGISGTALLEAAVLGKPTHAFGLPEFLDVIGSRGHNEFPEFVHRCVKNDPNQNPIRAIRYIQYVLDNGREFDLYKLRNKQSTPEFEKGIGIVYEMLSEVLEEDLTTDRPYSSID